MKKAPFVYCVCRINTKYFQTINQDLQDRGYSEIKAIIPTIHILKKSRKGKDTYEEHPLLFNYGFMKMRTDKAYDRNFLRKIQKDIPGVSSFLRSLETMHPKKQKLRVDNAEDFDDFSIVATVHRKVVREFKRLSSKNKIYSSEDIAKLNIGDYIVLRGYPFEGMSANIEDINLTTKQITVNIPTYSGNMIIQLPLDNILYSIYQDYNEYKLMGTKEEYDLSTIPDGSTGDILSNKQF